MPEIGIPYVLTGPDGSRAVFGDSSDVDFVGYLDSENGITGLLDTADVRESKDVKPEAHGGIQGNNFFGGKVGTLQGIVWPNPDMPTVNARISKINRASRALSANAPCFLTWTPSGGIQRWIRLWRQGNNRFPGRRPKQFLVALATPDPYIYSASVQSQVITPGGSSGDQGFTNPMANPITTAYSVSGAGSISNQGDVATPPQFTVVGPINNPTLLNNTTGQSFTLTCSLASTDTLVVDTQLRTVFLNGTINRYSYYAANISSNTWWSLQPGSNDVRLLSASFSTGAQVTVNWRHAWEI